MKIELKNIKIKDIVKGYENNDEGGVVGFDGRLNIRPAYQREFVYKDKQRDAVIDTIRKDFPLNVMYWSKAGVDEDGNDLYELLDGQQRTISFCQYYNKEFSVKNSKGNPQYFFNLTPDEQNQFLEYECQVYICEGTDVEKLDWFETINIAGEKLTAQELRNAVYVGPWLTKAKQFFSKNKCLAYQKGKNYIKGTPIRQAFLEEALDWISDRDGCTIEEYMSNHQTDTNINDIKLYFLAVIDWIEATFTTYRKEMQGLNWGQLYNLYHDTEYEPDDIELRIKDLIDDDDVTNIKGIYAYILSGDEKTLNIRTFDDKIKRKVYEAQAGICPECGKHFDIDEMEADHIVPWHDGGKTEESNCQMLCKHCNRTKSGK